MLWARAFAQPALQGNTDMVTRHSMVNAFVFDATLYTIGYIIYLITSVIMKVAAVVDALGSAGPLNRSTATRETAPQPQRQLHAPQHEHSENPEMHVYVLSHVSDTRADMHDSRGTGASLAATLLAESDMVTRDALSCGNLSLPTRLATSPPADLLAALTKDRTIPRLATSPPADSLAAPTEGRTPQHESSENQEKHVHVLSNVSDTRADTPQHESSENPEKHVHVFSHASETRADMHDSRGAGASLAATLLAESIIDLS